MKFQKPIKIKELINDGVIKSVYICDENTDILSGFATDLLSHGIDKAQKGDAWLTILTNHNIMAPASISEVSCLILCDNTQPTEMLIKRAEMMNINLLKTELSIFDTAVYLSKYKG